MPTLLLEGRPIFEVKTEGVDAAPRKEQDKSGSEKLFQAALARKRRSFADLNEDCPSIFNPSLVFAYFATS